MKCTLKNQQVKIFTFFLFFLFAGYTASCQKPKIYNPEADAMQDLNKAIDLANQQGKHVMIQIGRNWCPWCIKMHRFFQENNKVDSLIHANYVFLRINYSKENKNLDVLQKLEYPQRFGLVLPVLAQLRAAAYKCR